MKMKGKCIGPKYLSKIFKENYESNIWEVMIW